MSNSAYDIFLDKELERYYEEQPDGLKTEDLLYQGDGPTSYPEDDYANYDGWDDAMTKEIKVTVVEASEIEQYNDGEGFIFKHPSKYYFVNAMGQYIYIHTRDMKVAVEYIKENYDGRYVVRTAKQSAGGGDYTCTGSNSRKGMASHLRPTV